MKKIVCILLILSCIMSMQVVSATPTADVIEQYNFEDSLATIMSTWSYYTSESEGKIAVNTTNYTQGKSSIRVTDDNASVSIGILSPKKTVTPGSLFKISFDGYLHSGKSFAIVRFYKSDGTYLSSDDILIRLSEKNVWKTYEYEKYLPSYAATCRIFLLSYSTDLGDASFDNIVMSATTTADVISEYNFEDSLATTMSTWSYYTSESEGKIAVNTTNYTQGKSSIRVTDDDASVSIGILSPKNKVTPGSLFKISFDGYLHSGKGLAIVRFFKSDGTYLSSDDIQINLSEKNAWKTYAYEKYLPSYVTDYRIYLLSYSTNLGDASYDNIKVYQGDVNSINNKTGFIAPVQNATVNAQIVSPDGGNLVYNEYDGKGGKLTDFSHAGFYGGKYEIPDSDNLTVGAVINPYAWSDEEITAKTADDTARIQSVIDNVSSAYPDNKMTVIKLKAGKYYISSVGLSLPSGIVLSGEGQGPTGTILYAYEANNSDSSMVIKVIGNAHSKGTHNCYITDSYVPSGSNKITLSSYDASFFNVGDTFIIHYESTDEWTESIGMSSPIINVYDTDTGWGAGDVVKIHEREITAINGNEITFDIPLEMHLDNKLMPAYIYKINTDARVRNAGIENLRIESYFDPTITGSTGYVDENHSRYLIYFRHAQDCYVENVTTKYIFFSAIYFGNYAKRITARNCSSLEPVSLIEGNRRYPFLCMAFSQQILVTGCYSEKGRHDYATSHRASGPTAYVDNVADNSFAISEPHATWSTGILYDNIYHVGSDAKGYIGITNRGIYGTDISQGWTGVGCVVWNSLANTIVAHDVPGDYQNFLVGNWGTYHDFGATQRKEDNIVTMTDMYRKTGQVGGTDANMATSSDTSLVGDAYKESGTAPVNPRSLFKAQLALRITGDYRNQKPNAPILTYPKSDELFSSSQICFYGLYQKGATGVNIYVDDVKHSAKLDSSQNTFDYSLNLSDGVHKIYTTQVVDGLESNKSADRFVIIKNQGNYTNTLSSNYSHKTLSLISQDTRMTFDEYLDTVSDVIEISDVQGFKAIANNLSGNYKLTGNIDLSEDYTPISSFTGILDGNGFTVNLGTGATQGIFKTASNFTIKNLTVKGSVNATANAGAFVGDADGTATFINCTNFADVTAKTGNASYVGGILGDGFDDCTALSFENCINYGTIDVNGNTKNNSGGGILGVGRNTTIKNCVNYGKIDGQRYAGGLIGWSTNRIELSNCANFGYISSQGANKDFTGGVFGYISSYPTGSIKNFFNAGQVINGVAGSNGTNVASLSISCCVNVGVTVNAMTNMAGATTTDCYYLAGTGSDSTGATSKTSAQLKTLTLNGYAKQEGYDYPLPSGIEYVSKEEANIVKISTAAEFVNIANNLSGSYKLTKDIDLSNCGYTAISGFAGVLDGNGFTVNLGNNATQGIFATVSNATIKNLTVKGSINATTNAGAFAGASTGTGTFINCINFADVKAKSGASYVGGILGNGFDNSTASTFENCINYGTIDVNGNTKNNSSGGIIGVSRNTEITNCINYGRIDGHNKSGGLIGWGTYKLEVSNCANFGHISSGGDGYENQVGGLVGSLKYTPNGYIKNFFNAGQAISGVVGHFPDGTYPTALPISNCVNVGATNQAMTNITGAKTSNCYFLADTGSDSTGATSKTSDELKKLNIEGFTVPTDIYGVEYPVPCVLTLTTNNVTVTASAGGSVSPSGTFKVIYGTSVTIKITPDAGYYADCSYNGVDITLNSNNSYTTPEIKAVAEFDVKFAKLADIDVSGAVTMHNGIYKTSSKDSEYYYGENGSVITFAKAKKVGPLTVTECGLLVDRKNSMTNDELVYDGEGVRVLPFKFKNSLTADGSYGILIYNNTYTQGKIFKVRAYAKYSNGKIAYSEPKEISFDEIR